MTRKQASQRCCALLNFLDRPSLELPRQVLGLTHSGESAWSTAWKSEAW